MVGFLAVGVRIIQEPWFEKKIKDLLISSFTKEFSCTYKAEIIAISFFPTTIECTNVICTDKNNRWSWQAPKLYISFSFLSLFLKKYIGLTVHVYDATLTTETHIISLHMAFENYIREWIETPQNLPIQLIGLHLHNVAVTGLDTYGALSFQTTGSLNVSGNRVYIHGTVSRGLYDTHCNSAEGTYRFIIGNSTIINASFEGSFKVPYVEKSIITSLVWENKKGIYRCHSSELWIEGMVSAEVISCKGHIPLIYPFVSILNVEGHYHPHLQGIELTGVLEKFKYGVVTVPECSFKITKKKEAVSLQGICSVFECSGMYSLNDAEWKFEGTNKENCVVPVFGNCEPHTTSFTIWGNGQNFSLIGALEASSHSLAFSFKNNTVHASSGKHAVYYDSGTQTGGYTYDMQHVLQLRKNGTRFAAQADLQKLTTVLSDNGYDFLKGAGIVHVDGSYTDALVDAELKFDMAHIRLSYFYNTIQSGNAHISAQLDKRCITVDNCLIKMNQGALEIPRLHVSFTPEGAIDSGVFPLMIHDCFVHWKKDIVATVSGLLISTIEKGFVPTIKGHLNLDKTFIQSNILSSDFKKTVTGGIVRPFAVYPFDLEMDIHVTSHMPIKVQTPFLKTSMLMQLAIRGTLNAPQLSGSLHLDKGSLEFPFKPLYITSGTVYFLPNQLDDPMIELTARNSIKKYMITLHITGPVSRPQIIFDASPFLTEGQIITLLLGGSDDGSLFFAMPASLTSMIENLIFGPVENLSTTQRTLHSIFSSLRKMVRIVPTFSDEQGRGGVRGSLLIDVNDRLHAKIQNNFTLSEDTTFDIEYALSDSMALHVVKDERRDLGVELEKVWKF